VFRNDIPFSIEELVLINVPNNLNIGTFPKKIKDILQTSKKISKKCQKEENEEKKKKSRRPDKTTLSLSFTSSQHPRSGTTTTIS